MGWLFELHKTQPIAHAVGVLTFVCVLGMALGSVKFRGIGLGTSGVLFAGILVEHFGEEVDHQTLDFREGVRPDPFRFHHRPPTRPRVFRRAAPTRSDDERMNALAAVIVVLGAVGAPLIGWLTGFDAAAVLGIFSGASTNTPSLGAGRQTLNTLPGIAADRLTLPALAYAVTYPTAIVGIIGVLVLLKQSGCPKTSTRPPLPSATRSRNSTRRTSSRSSSASPSASPSPEDLEISKLED